LILPPFVRMRLQSEHLAFPLFHGSHFCHSYSLLRVFQSTASFGHHRLWFKKFPKPCPRSRFPLFHVHCYLFGDSLFPSVSPPFFLGFAPSLLPSPFLFFSPSASAPIRSRWRPFTRNWRRLQVFSEILSPEVDPFPSRFLEVLTSPLRQNSCSICLKPFPPLLAPLLSHGLPVSSSRVLQFSMEFFGSF